MSTPLPPLSALAGELVKAIAQEVIRLQREEEAKQTPEGKLPISVAAKKVGRHPRTLKNWIRAKVIQGYVIRGNWYVDAREFEEFQRRSDGKRRRSTLKIA